jgi:hypothetical protein
MDLYNFRELLNGPKELARVQGLEPRHPESESGVLPLDDTRQLIPLDYIFILILIEFHVKIVCTLHN